MNLFKLWFLKYLCIIFKEQYIFSYLGILIPSKEFSLKIYKLIIFILKNPFLLYVHCEIENFFENLGASKLKL